MLMRYDARESRPPANPIWWRLHRLLALLRDRVAAENDVARLQGFDDALLRDMGIPREEIGRRVRGRR